MLAQGTVRVRSAAPGLFAANANGIGVAAAQIVQAQGGEVTSRFVFTDAPAGSRMALPIDLGGPSRDSVLVLFGTGVRGGGPIQLLVDGEAQQVLFSGAQSQFIGLDQINVRLSRKLAGSGLADVVVVADGFPSNAAQVLIL